jgi:hypothetical protein
MPKILDRLVNQLKSKGKTEQQAQAIARVSLAKAGDLTRAGNATAKGARRGDMTPEQRADSRAKKYAKERK